MFRAWPLYQLPTFGMWDSRSWSKNNCLSIGTDISSFYSYSSFNTRSQGGKLFFYRSLFGKEGRWKSTSTYIL